MGWFSQLSDRHWRSWSARGLSSTVAALAALAAVAVGPSACSGGLPGAPAASSGTVESRAIPSQISALALTDQRGQSVSLSAFRGRTVMLVPFLTLCSDICPMTSGNLLQVEHSLRAAHLADEVQIVELSVDPD